MRSIWISGTLAALILVTLPGGARAANEFENGFKTELGAIGARTAVGILFSGLNGYFGNRTGNVVSEEYISSGYYPRVSNSYGSPQYPVSSAPAAPQYTYRPTSYEPQYRGSPPTQVVVVEQPVSAQAATTVVVQQSGPASTITNTTIFKTNVLRSELASLGIENIAWQDLKKFLLRSAGYSSANANVVTTEGIAFSETTLFKVSTINSELSSLRIENVTWQDMRKILARSMN